MTMTSPDTERDRFGATAVFEQTGSPGRTAHLTFAFASISSTSLASTKTGQLLSTTSTLRNQLAKFTSAQYVSMDPQSYWAGRRRPLSWLRRRGTAVANAVTNAAAGAVIKGKGQGAESYSQLTLQPVGTLHMDLATAGAADQAPSQPARVQRRAQVAWARLPFCISSSDPHAAENNAVSFLLYEAEQEELETVRVAELQRHSTLSPAAQSVESVKHVYARWWKPWAWRRAQRSSSLNQAMAASSTPNKGAQGRQHMPKLHSPEEVAVWELFASIDTDGSGSIEKAELAAALQAMGLPASREYMHELMGQFDDKHDSSIGFSQFKSAMKRRDGDIVRAFRRIDADGDGVISVAELAASLRRANLPCCSEQDAAHMLGLLANSGDANASASASANSRCISLPEFRRFTCMLPLSQTASAEHVLYAWANSSLWSQQELRRAQQVSSPDEQSQRLLVGGLSGVVSRTLIAPIERLRTLMMLSTRAGLLASCRHMWADGGLLGLWKGHSSTVMKVFPCSAIQFGVVDAVRKLIVRAKGPGGEVNQLECFLAGCLAGGTACIVSHPMDTIRTHMTAAIGQRTSMLRVARSLGMLGLYRGFRLSLMQEVLGSGIGFLAVDVGSQLYRHLNEGRSPSAQERGMIAALAASAVMTAVMPLDVVVKRLQVQGCPGHPVLFSGPLHAFQTIAREEGLGAFYRGMLASYMKTAPSMGAIYFLYDRLSQALGIGGLNRYRMVSS